MLRAGERRSSGRLAEPLAQGPLYLADRSNPRLFQCGDLNFEWQWRITCALGVRRLG
jgi:hypothetical protein